VTTEQSPSSQQHMDRRVPSTEAAVIRSEEHLEIQTIWSPSRRIRIAKRVITESKTITVDVRHEELVIEEIPLGVDQPGVDQPGADQPGADQPGDEGRPAGLVLTLSKEHVVVDRQVTPVERVRVTVSLNAGAVEVSANLDQERIAVDHPRA
jgi:stress response protein YsnF